MTLSVTTLSITIKLQHPAKVVWAENKLGSFAVLKERMVQIHAVSKVILITTIILQNFLSYVIALANRNVLQKRLCKQIFAF
jgi:hypothetical protein